ncbi:MAG: hypothetical protein RL653_1496, partial [Pseudomonadota bacterium]
VEVEVEWPGGARSRAQLSVDGRHVLAQPSAPVGLVQ